MIKLLALALCLGAYVYAETKISGYASDKPCEDYLKIFINYGFEGNITVWQQRYKRSGKCYISGDGYLINNIKGQNQRIEKVYEINAISRPLDNLLMIHGSYPTGDIIEFLKIENSGNISRIENGRIADTPSIYIDSQKNEIEVTRKIIKDSETDHPKEITSIYRFDNKKYIFNVSKTTSITKWAPGPENSN